MEFRYDPSRKHLAVREPTLYELFQSSKAEVPSDSRVSGGAAEAYICSEKENNSLKVYLAFWDTSSKVTRIYTPESQPCGTREYQDCIDNARKYLTDLGFSMEQVNLNYSTAMRQVIWGAIKIFKAPKIYAKQEKKKVVDPAPSPGHVANPEPEIPLALSGEQGAAVVSAGHTEMPLTKFEFSVDSVCNLDQELSASRIELDQALDEVKRLQKKLNVQILAHEDERAYLEAEISTLKEQISLLEAGSGEDAHEPEHEQTIRMLNEEILELKSLLTSKELEAAHAGEELAVAVNALNEAETGYSGRLEALENERDALDASLSALREELSQAGLLFAETCANNEESARAFERNISIERELRERTEKELLLLGQERDQIERVATAALNSAREERKELVEKIEAQEGEKRRMKEEFEAILEELRQSEERAKAEVLGLKRELYVKEGVSARELAGLRGELKRLIEEQAAGETGRLMIEAHQVEIEPDIYSDQFSITDVESYPVTEPVHGSSCDEESGQEGIELICPVMDSEDSAAFSMSEETGDSVTEFRPNNQLARVHCSSPDDLVVLYESQNKVQTVPDGFKIQKSGGYICAIKRNGKPEIFLVWKMLESKQAVFYTPRQQPKDEKGFQQVLQDALFYFDSIGFMMSPVDLSAPANRSKAIHRIQFAG